MDTWAKSYFSLTATNSIFDIWLCYLFSSEHEESVVRQRFEGNKDLCYLPAKLFSSKTVQDARVGQCLSSRKHFSYIYAFRFFNTLLLFMKTQTVQCVSWLTNSGKEMSHFVLMNTQHRYLHLFTHTAAPSCGSLHIHFFPLPHFQSSHTHGWATFLFVQTFIWGREIICIHSWI